MVDDDFLDTTAKDKNHERMDKCSLIKIKISIL
jgi:hypothetical protein